MFLFIKLNLINGNKSQLGNLNLFKKNSTIAKNFRLSGILKTSSNVTLSENAFLSVDCLWNATRIAWFAQMVHKDRRILYIRRVADEIQL
jgi:hypothetical protein